MTRRMAVSILTVVLSGAPGTLPGDEEALLGFLPGRVEAHRALEARFDSVLDRENLRQWMKRLTARPHHVGSEQVKKNAQYVAGLFRSWGYDTAIEVFHVLFPTPRIRELEMLEPVRFRASLREEVVGSDSAASTLAEEGLPPYNAYSADGDVTGELVYVNQGLPADYEELERRDISVKGRIVIARYGGSWRGIKPKVAAEKGAVGCILYNDPREDGYYQGPPYPEGAFKHETAVQRGSVVDLPRRPGDPLTPGYGGTPGAPRLERQDAETILSIPVLPISRRDALPLLRALEGPVAPLAWRGALPITYRIGPGPARVRLKLAFNWDLVPAHSVIARMEGQTHPDQWILRGNHHDAWGIGGTDPISGLVALMEEGRAIGELARNGWRPRRTLVFCAWDAEEPGLLGSTDWAEHHAELLRERAVAYINSDSNTRGFLRAGGSHSLERLVEQVARDVPDPQTGVSVLERLRSALLVRGSPEEKQRARKGTDLRLNALGSGSDYSVFLQHLGVASLDVRFRGEDAGGEYHTLFDTFDHFTRFKDPSFEYGITLARVCGRLMLRLSEADILPFDFRRAGRTIGGYVDEVISLADAMRRGTEERNFLIREGHFRRALDPREKIAPPPLRESVPYINFAPLRNAHDHLETAARAHEAARRAALAGKPLSPEHLDALNRLLFRSERALVREGGLPRRPWFRHQIYAPGYYTGYGVKTLPGVREAIEARGWKETAEQIAHVTAALERFTAAVRRAAALLERHAEE